MVLTPIMPFLPYHSTMTTIIAILQVEMVANLPKSLSVSLLNFIPDSQFPNAWYSAHTIRNFSAQFLPYEIRRRSQTCMCSHTHYTCIHLFTCVHTHTRTHTLSFFTVTQESGSLRGSTATTEFCDLPALLPETRVFHEKAERYHLRPY